MNDDLLSYADEEFASTAGDVIPRLIGTLSSFWFESEDERLRIEYAKDLADKLAVAYARWRSAKEALDRL